MIRVHLRRLLELRRNILRQGCNYRCTRWINKWDMKRDNRLRNSNLIGSPSKSQRLFWIIKNIPRFNCPLLSHKIRVPVNSVHVKIWNLMMKDVDRVSILVRKLFNRFGKSLMDHLIGKSSSIRIEQRKIIPFLEIMMMIMKVLNWQELIESIRNN